MTLDRRLQAVASMVPVGTRLADIGTDHARLPIVLVGRGHCPSAVATDIHRGPWLRAAAAVERAGLTDRIAVRLGDGLRPVSPDEAETVVIAGLGGETIAAIVAEAPWTADPAKTLVLQPMSKPERLRAWLTTHGYALREEHPVEDGRRLYTVLRAVYDPATAAGQQTDRILYGGVLTAEEGRVYRQRVARRLRAAAAARGDAVPGRESLLAEWDPPDDPT